MIFLRIILYPFSLIYGLITAIRNFFYNSGIFNTIKIDAFVINVGNLSVGGTGKTPHVEYLANLLQFKKLAILSRGYGRKTKGVIIADEKSTPQDIGDEPFQYMQKFNFPICVAERRVEGAQKLIYERDVDTIILDDAYQHRSIYRNLNILITEYANLLIDDFMMPLGQLREFRQGARRAHAVVISKCPTDLSDQQMIEIEQRFAPFGHPEMFFSKIVYNDIPDISEVVLVTGISNPKPLLAHLENKKVKIIKHLNYRDHYKYTQSDIDGWHKKYENYTILTTEKDYTKISFLDTMNLNIKKLPIKVEFFGSDFDTFVLSKVEGASGE